MGKRRSYTMTNTVLGALTAYSLKYQFAERKVPIKTTVHLSIWEEKHHVRLGESRGCTVYNAKTEKILSIVIEALKTAGFEGTFGAESPSLTTQLSETLKAFNPVTKPCCPKCGKVLKAGDKVISLVGVHRRNVYHKSCYQSTLY